MGAGAEEREGETERERKTTTTKRGQTSRDRVNKEGDRNELETDVKQHWTNTKCTHTSQGVFTAIQSHTLTNLSKRTPGGSKVCNGLLSNVTSSCWVLFRSPWLLKTRKSIKHTVHIHPLWHLKTGEKIYKVHSPWHPTRKSVKHAVMFCPPQHLICCCCCFLKTKNTVTLHQPWHLTRVSTMYTVKWKIWNRFLKKNH